MKTFSEIYCAEHHCELRAFEWQVFWRGLHRFALPIAPLALWVFPNHFSPDWELIRCAGRCRSLRQIEEEIVDFTMDPANQLWWRRFVRVRVSTQRLRRLARNYLPARDRSALAAGGATS